MAKRSSRSRTSARSQLLARPLLAFLLVASFGILFAGCGGEQSPDEFVITDSDMEHFQKLADEAEGKVASVSGAASSVRVVEIDASDVRKEAGSAASAVSAGQTASRAAQPVIPALDLSRVPQYDAIRKAAAVSADGYVVNAATVNLRSQPNAKAGALLASLPRGTGLQLIDFIDGTWARVRTADGKDGFVTHRAIAKPVTDGMLEAEKKKFENTYYVNYSFLNVRASADQKSEKLGEIPGQSIVRPLSKDAKWAKVSFQGKEGYVAAQYLSPLLPVFLVRQETFTLPVLVYDLSQQGALEAMAGHVGALRNDGVAFLTLRSLHDQLVEKGENARISGKNVVVALTGLTPANVKPAADKLNALGVAGTLFIRTDQVGMRGITEKMLLTLAANGMDIESATHAGDDLRTLTSAQVELELKQSRKMLEDMSRRSIVAVLYPGGGVNDRVEELAGAAGYLLGVSNSAERSFTRAQLLRLPSYPIFPSMSVDEVLRIGRGA